MYGMPMKDARLQHNVFFHVFMLNVFSKDY